MLSEAGAAVVLALAAIGPLPGDRPQLLPPTTGPLVGVPQTVAPSLTAGPYVYPVFGASSFVDAYGSYSDAGGFDHGAELYGQLGQPLVAVTDGTVFSIGWKRGAGNRLLLRDRQGNVFEYANLAAFATETRVGAHVKAGEVIGFMGAVGPAAGAPHLHFEVHPVSMLYLGSDAAVDPGRYAPAWRRLQNLPYAVEAGWAPKEAGTSSLPEPGAALIGATDIASGGLSVAKR